MSVGKSARGLMPRRLMGLAASEPVQEIGSAQGRLGESGGKEGEGAREEGLVQEAVAEEED